MLRRRPIIDVWLATTRHDLEYSDEKEPDTLENGWTKKRENENIRKALREDEIAGSNVFNA